jgi:hypothetical protein
MADFSPITLAQATHKAGIGQDFMRQVRDNFDNHQSALAQLISSIRLFDHFNWKTASGSSPYLSYETVVDDDASPGVFGHGRDWIYCGKTGGTTGRTQGNSNKPSTSVARMNTTATGADFANAWSRMGLNFGEITKPITYVARHKLSADCSFYSGFREGPFAELASVNEFGCWIERVDSTNWRFACFDGTTKNNGASFTHPSSGTWFEVKIIFTNTPGNQLDCYLDSVFKYSLTANLPTGQMLQAHHGLIGGTAGNLDTDRVLFSAEGIADAA